MNRLGPVFRSNYFSCVTPPPYFNSEQSDFIIFTIVISSVVIISRIIISSVIVTSGVSLAINITLDKDQLLVFAAIKFHKEIKTMKKSFNPKWNSFYIPDIALNKDFAPKAPTVSH